MKIKAFKILKLLRPKQWIKNFAVFAPVLFTGQLFNFSVITNSLLAFGAFCGLSSAVYIVNDIFDVKKDKLHPFKKFRPIANNDIPIPFAVFLALAIAILSLYMSLWISFSFFLLSIIYICMQLFYSMLLKHIAILDILTLAAGYILRVYAGEVASSYHISVWLILTTVSLSLFLAVGKRRSELALLASSGEKHAELIRKTLSHYSAELLDVYISVFVTATFMFYSLFTFLESSSVSKITLNVLMSDFLPSFFQKKWLMITILPVVYGLMRYVQLMYEKQEGESPEQVVFTDKPLLASVIIWVLLVIIIIYFLKGN